MASSSYSSQTHQQYTPNQIILPSGIFARSSSGIITTLNMPQQTLQNIVSSKRVPQLQQQILVDQQRQQLQAIAKHPNQQINMHLQQQNIQLPQQQTTHHSWHDQRPPNPITLLSQITPQE